MNNKKLSVFWKNPGKAYMSMNSDDLNDVFSKGYANVVKSRCKKAYTMTDLKLAILQANQAAKTDTNIYTVDLMLFALGKLEDYEETLYELEKVLEELEKEKSEVKKEDKSKK